MRMTDADRGVARLSRKQHGAWSRRQALGVGMTSKMIETRVRSGEWVGLDFSVYGHIAAPATWDRSIMAAVLAEPWAVASHRAAAVLHDLTGFRRGRPEITIRPGANARGRLAIARRGVDVRTTTVRGIPVVTTAQTFVDLAQVVSERKVRAALADRADRDARLLDAIRDRYCALAPRGGRDLRPLKSVLDRFGAGDLPEPSELHRHLVAAMATRGMPDIEWEASFPGRKPGPQRVDALIPRWRVVVEGDGRAWHTRLEDFERDRRRDAEAAAAGYVTLRFTWHQLVAERSWVRRITLDTGAQRSGPEVRGTWSLAGRSDAPNQTAA
jgi:hypothetical protein